MKTMRNHFCLVIGLILFAVSGHAATVVYYSFNSTNVVPDIGSSLSAFFNFNPAGSALTFPAGSTLNAQPGFPAGVAVSQSDWTNAAARTYFLFTFNSANFERIVVSFWEQKSATGPSSVEFQYSLDNIFYSTFATLTSSNAPGNVHTVDLSSLTTLTTQPTVYFRLSSANASSGLGTYRIDNLTIDAVTANSWINGTGKWEIGANWSRGIAPSISDGADYIVNDTNKIVTIDGSTPGGTMTISNLTVSAPVNSTNTLFLNNAGLATPLRILNGLTLTSGGAISITNSVLRVDGLSGGGFLDNGSVLLNTGSIITTNVAVQVGNAAPGALTVSNGTWLAKGMTVGGVGGSQGTLTIAGGTNRLSDVLSIGSSNNATGTVWMTGSTAQLVVTNNSATIGNFGTGRMTMSNGTWLADSITVGLNGGSQGTLTVAGGTNSLSSFLLVAASTFSTGAVWVTGGQLTVLSSSTSIGGTGMGQMTVSNGAFLASGTFLGNSAGSRGTLTFVGGTNTASELHLAYGSGASGTLWMKGGQFTVASGLSHIGEFGTGQMIVSNGTVSMADVIIAENAGATGSVVVAGGNLEINGILVLANAAGSFNFISGTVSANDVLEANGQTLIVGNGGTALLTLSTGIHKFADDLALGSTLASTGTLVVASGQLMLTNSELRIGGLSLSSPGVGLMIVSNGTVVAKTLRVCSQALGGKGTLTIAGGTVNALTLFDVAELDGATGTVWMVGGELIATNNFTLGISGKGRMTVSNGTVTARVMTLGNFFANGAGTLTAVGGTSTVYSNMTLGNACAVTGIVIVAGGEIDVTNATGNATLEVRTGSVTLNSGTLMIDRLVLTDSCGHFFRNGGTLITGTNILASALDADGDGIPNGYEQSHGLDPLNPADANLDSDGDGLSNLQEYLAGTNPTNSASFFGITSIAKESNDIRVTWMTGPNKTNALERTAGVAGSFTNNFSVLTNIVTTGTVTNYLDIGVATNVPAFYYRVRLVQ